MCRHGEGTPILPWGSPAQAHAKTEMTVLPCRTSMMTPSETSCMQGAARSKTSHCLQHAAATRTAAHDARIHRPCLTSDTVEIHDSSGNVFTSILRERRYFASKKAHRHTPWEAILPDRLVEGCTRFRMQKQNQRSIRSSGRVHPGGPGLLGFRPAGHEQQARKIKELACLLS